MLNNIQFIDFQLVTFGTFKINVYLCTIKIKQ